MHEIDHTSECKSWWFFIQFDQPWKCLETWAFKRSLYRRIAPIIFLSTQILCENVMGTRFPSRRLKLPIFHSFIIDQSIVVQHCIDFFISFVAIPFPLVKWVNKKQHIVELKIQNRIIPIWAYTFHWSVLNILPNCSIDCPNFDGVNKIQPMMWSHSNQ